MDLVERYCPHCGAASVVSDAACGACGASLKVTRQLDTKKSMPAPPSLRLAVHLQTLQLFNERYRIVRQVGVGGFGAVYEAADTWEPRRVAIKEISLTGLSAQQVIEATGSFNREVQMLSSLQHAGIPRMYEQSTDAGHWYLIMEFIAGKTLEDTQGQADGGRLSLEHVLRIGVQICAVLEYLHSQRPAVIFRDIKPANIMLTPQGNLYLIDFGVSRRYQQGRARDTIAFGSPGYAAPEQYGRAQTTPLADIYSLGALLYCLLTGDDPSEHPFQFPPLRFYGVDGIRELDVLLQRMVASNPAQRPQRVRAELQRIQQIYYQSKKRTPLWIPPRGQTPPAMVALSGRGLQPQKNVSTPSTFVPQGQRPPTPPLTTGAGQQQKTPAPQGQVAAVAVSGGQQQQQMLFAPPAPGPQPPVRKTSRRRVLVGSLIAGGSLLSIGLVAAWESSRNTSVTTAAIVGNTPSTMQAIGAPTPLIPHNGATSWSADLHYAAVADSAQNQLEIYSTYPQNLLYTIPSTYDDGRVQWSPNNHRFFSAPDSSVWNAITGKLIYRLASSLSQAFISPGYIAWSPNSKYIVGNHSDFQKASIALLEAANGKVLFQTTMPGYNVANVIAWSPDSRYIVFPDTDNAAWTAGNPWSAAIMDIHTFQQAGTLGSILPSRQYTSAYSSVSGIAWSPDGKLIAVAIDEHIWLCTLSSTTGSIRITNTQMIGVPLNSMPLWSSDSRYLAYFSHTSLSVYDVVMSQTVTLINNNPLSTIAAMAWTVDTKSITGVDDNNGSSTWTFV